MQGLLPTLLLQRNEEVRERWQNKIRYLLVDEYQDTNTSQYEMVKLLVGQRARFTVVGDDDQSIYSWRGARPQNLVLLSQDFPALRVSIKAQMQDKLARRTGDMQSNLAGAFALSIANNFVGSGVDAMVTPLGIGALLQGRSLWKKTLGETADGDSYSKAVPVDPLKQAVRRYESPSRFTATVLDEDGKPMVFVFKRNGLRWKLADIRLPV